MRARQRGSLNDESPLQECLAENDRDWRACQKGVPTLACKVLVPQKEPMQSVWALHLAVERFKPEALLPRRCSRGGCKRMQTPSSDAFAPCKGPSLRLGSGNVMMEPF